MRVRLSRTLAGLASAGWLMVLFHGCSGEQHLVECPRGVVCRKDLPDGVECIADAECQSRYCDPALREHGTVPLRAAREPVLVDHPQTRGRCGVLRTGLSPNGGECAVNAHCQSGVCHYDVCVTPGEPLPNRAECNEDADCQSGYCDDGRCAVLRADLLPNGKPCSADAQCQMGLCDRGVCARVIVWRNYGLPCIVVQPGTPTPQGPEVTNCFGYLCLDGRCRSCQSESECTFAQLAAGAAPLKDPLTCTKFNDWPGKQCGKVVPGQVCPNGNPPAPATWPDEGPGIPPSIAPAVALPDGSMPVRPKPAMSCRSFRDH